MKSKLFKKDKQLLFKIIFIAIFLLATRASFAKSDHEDSTIKLYKTNCAECHNENRLGGIGPALLPENLKYLRHKAAIKVIQNGRAATQMPAFKGKLNAKEIQSLVDFIYSPLDKIPAWGMQHIKASHIIHNSENSLANKPVFDVKDYLNLFLVVERGEHHVSLLDGDTFEPVHRFKSRFALRGQPVFSPSGRFVYFASRDGWISKYDIYNLKLVAEVRAGINTRNQAISADGRYIMVANYSPHSMVLLSARDLTPIKLFQAKNTEGKTSRVSAVYTAPPRNSFIAALKDIPELWEVSYEDDPPVGFGMWVHDYRVDSGENMAPVPFPLRRINVDDYLDDFFFDEEYVSLLGITGKKKAQVVDLDVRKVVVPAIDLPGKPRFSSGVSFQYKGRRLLLVPNLRKGIVSVLDMESWKEIKQIKTLGPGFYMQSHKNSRYVWVDVFFGPNKDVMHIIDKRSLEVVKTFRPVTGKRSSHVEFTRDGKYALLSIWDQHGAVIVYDATTLKEIKRVPMNKPSGKYNVYNSTRYIEPQE